MIFNDIDGQASDGLLTAFSVSGEVYSPFTESGIWMSQCYPGLSGIVRTKRRDVIVLFVDEFVPSSALVIHVEPPKSSDPEIADPWRVHVQNQLYGWQFSCLRDSPPNLGENPLVIFIRWTPGSLKKAVLAHDEMYVRKPFRSDELLVGTDYEKESLSRFHLATGISSIAHVMAGMGIVSALSKAAGRKIPLTAGFADSGLALPAVEV